MGLPKVTNARDRYPTAQTHHLRQLTAEGPLRALGELAREYVIFEHQVIGNGRGEDHHVRVLGLEGGVHEPGLRGLDVAAVAAAALGVEEQVVLAEQLPHVRLQRHQVGRILGVASDRHGAGDMPVQKAERPAEEIDARGDDRRAHAVFVEDEQLDQVVGVALVVRRVDDASGARGDPREVDVLGDALDLAEDRVEGVLQRAVDRVALRGVQLLEVALDPLARGAPALAATALEIPGDLLS